jgi:hypothetical protein
MKLFSICFKSNKVEDMFHLQDENKLYLIIQDMEYFVKNYIRSEKNIFDKSVYITLKSFETKFNNLFQKIIPSDDQKSKYDIYKYKYISIQNQMKRYLIKIFNEYKINVSDEIYEMFLIYIN